MAETLDELITKVRTRVLELNTKINVHNELFPNKKNKTNNLW